MTTINGNNFLNFFSNTDRGGDIDDGGTRADILVGGTGDDQFYIDHVDDRVIENPNEGDYDGIIASVSYSLFSAPNVEYLVLENGTPALGGVGNELDNVIYGNTLNNTLAGNDGDDTLNGLVGNDDLEGGSGDDSLDGAAGDDRMSGNVGNDIYFVNSVGDEVIEFANNGVDTVRTSINYTLGEHLENLTLLDKESLDSPDVILHVNATGNELDNTITGNIWNNVLDGKTGNDTLIGGLGDDTYIVNDLSETIIESADGGVDTVIASVSYTLGANIENLTLTGDTHINGTGNALNNTLRGSTYNNILNGKEGDDTLIGGLGSDTYIVNDAGDQVIEGVNEGRDVILASVSYTMSDNIEYLVLTETGNFNGTGNMSDNVMIGNAGVNTLDGAAGNDILIGAARQDRLTGDAGADKFVFATPGDGVDRISDFSRQEGDKLVLVTQGFTGLDPNNFQASQFTLGRRAKDADDRLIYHKKSGNLFYDVDGQGGVARVKIATLDNKPVLGANDFQIVASPIASVPTSILF